MKRRKIHLFVMSLFMLMLSSCINYGTNSIGTEDIKEIENNDETDTVDLPAAVPAFEKCTVEFVVDGDTIEVAADNDIIRVRFIGVDTPESVNRDEEKNCPEGFAASEFTKNVLYPGREIFLEYDVEKEDCYGRTLAYVWLKEDINVNDFDDFKNYNFGAVLLQNTYCRAVIYEPNTKYKSWYEELDRDDFIK